MKIVVNKDLLPLKCLYFFELSIISSLYIYMTPFMNERGITATELAVINFVANIFALFSRPFFGYIADKYQKYKQLLILLAIVCTIVYSLHLASPKNPKDGFYSLKTPSNFNISIKNNILTMYSPDLLPHLCWPSHLNQCHFLNNIPASFNMSLNETGGSYATYVLKMGNNSLKSPSSSLNCLGIITSCNDSNVPKFVKSSVTIGLTWSSTFWFLGLCKTLGFIFYSPLVSLTDAVTFVTLGSANGNKFGFTRMFGTIGVLVFSMVMMGLLQLVNTLDTVKHWQWVSAMQRFSQFTPCFIVAGFIFISIIITASFLRIDKPIKSDKFLKSLDVIFQDCEITVFFLFAVIGGFLLQVFAEYFFLIMYQRYSPLPKYFPGLVTVVMTVSEGIIFGFSSHLFKFKSYEIWVSLSFLAWSLKWFAYIYVENFWFLLLTEALHGPSFALMLASMMSHIGKIGNSNTQGRMQGLFSAVYFNIGGACGGLVGGIVLDNLKYLGLFKFMAGLSLICCIYHPLQVYFISRLCKSSTKKPVVLAVENVDGDCNEKHLLSLDPIS